MNAELFWSFPAATLGAMGALILWQAPRRALLPAGLLGGLSWTLQRLLETFVCPEIPATFWAVMLTCLLAQWLARRMKMISTVFINATVVPSVPGLRLYRFMALLGRGSTAEAAVVGVEALELVLMITLAVAVAGYLTHILNRRRRRARTGSK